MNTDKTACIANKIYFLIVNYNSSGLIVRLIKSIDDNDRENCYVVIVNNSSEDKGLSTIKGKFIKVIESQVNLGFGKACNLGLNWIGSKNNQAIVWLLNPDAYFDLDLNKEASPISTTKAFFQEHPEISILGTTVYNCEGKITSVGGTFTPDTAALTIVDRLPKDLSQDYTETDWVSGCSLLINLGNFAEVPQFCDRFFLYYEDLDFCLRYGQQGHKIAATHFLKVVHDTSSITNRNIWQKYRHITQSYLVYIEKYGSRKTFILTNIRMLLNTIRLLVIKPKQGFGKLIGIYEYWQNKYKKYLF